MFEALLLLLLPLLGYPGSRGAWASHRPAGVEGLLVAAAEQGVHRRLWAKKQPVEIRIETYIFYLDILNCKL